MISSAGSYAPCTFLVILDKPYIILDRIPNSALDTSSDWMGISSGIECHT